MGNSSDFQNKKTALGAINSLRYYEKQGSTPGPQNNTGVSEQRKRQAYSKRRRLEVAKVRNVGACTNCRERKVRCKHALEPSLHESTSDEGQSPYHNSITNRLCSPSCMDTNAVATDHHPGKKLNHFPHEEELLQCMNGSGNDDESACQSFLWTEEAHAAPIIWNSGPHFDRRQSHAVSAPPKFCHTKTSSFSRRITGTTAARTDVDAKDKLVSPRMTTQGQPGITLLTREEHTHKGTATGLATSTRDLAATAVAPTSPFSLGSDPQPAILLKPTYFPCHTSNSHSTANQFPPPDSEAPETPCKEKHRYAPLRSQTSDVNPTFLSQDPKKLIMAQKSNKTPSDASILSNKNRQRLRSKPRKATLPGLNQPWNISTLKVTTQPSRIRQGEVSQTPQSNRKKPCQELSHSLKSEEKRKHLSSPILERESLPGSSMPTLNTNMKAFSSAPPQRSFNVYRDKDPVTSTKSNKSQRPTFSHVVDEDERLLSNILRDSSEFCVSPAPFEPNFGQGNNLSSIQSQPSPTLYLQQPPSNTALPDLTSSNIIDDIFTVSGKSLRPAFDNSSQWLYDIADPFVTSDPASSSRVFAPEIFVDDSFSSVQLPISLPNYDQEILFNNFDQPSNYNNVYYDTSSYPVPELLHGFPTNMPFDMTQNQHSQTSDSSLSYSNSFLDTTPCTPQNKNAPPIFQQHDISTSGSNLSRSNTEFESSNFFTPTSVASSLPSLYNSSVYYPSSPISSPQGPVVEMGSFGMTTGKDDIEPWECFDDSEWGNGVDEPGNSLQWLNEVENSDGLPP